MVILGVLTIGGVFIVSQIKQQQDAPFIGSYIVLCKKGESVIRLRREPSLDGNAEIGGISCGQIVEVSGGPTRGDNEDWLPVNYPPNSGYMAKKHLKKVSGLKKT